MAAGRVDFVVDQGEDFTAQLVWGDFTDNPIPVVPPIRMDLKSGANQIVHTMTVPDVALPAGEIPAITYNTDSGMIQLHIPKEVTATLTAGLYAYDLYCNVDDGAAYAGLQQSRLIQGNIIVGSRTTKGI